MAKLSDILLGFGTGALEEAATQRGERRKSEMEMASKLKLAEAEAKIKQRYPSASDLMAQAYLKQFFPGLGQPADMQSSIDTGAAPTSDYRPSSVYVKGMRLTSPSVIEENAAAQARGTAAGTPLTPQQEALTQGFRSMAKDLKTADAILSKDVDFKGSLFRTGLPFQPGAGSLADALKAAADTLLRLKSGAQINEDEYARLRSLLPTWKTSISEVLGNPDRSREQIARFQEAADDILSKKTMKSGEQVPIGTTDGDARSPEQDDLYQRLKSKYAR